MKFLNVAIRSNTEIAPDIYRMEVIPPMDAELPRAGQFAMIYLNDGTMLLPRPISFCDASADCWTFVYQVVGAGTRLMASCKNSIDTKIVSIEKFLAPLGKGFYTTDARSPLKKVALVGGGIGTPPLLLLAKTLKSQGATVDVYLGFRNQPILLDEFSQIVDNIFVATDDGSHGHKGNILEVVKSQITAYDEFLACGPRPMLNALADYAASKNIPCQISTEERMACGLGTCVGCVLEVSGSYVRICTEGPVFYSDEVSKHE